MSDRSSATSPLQTEHELSTNTALTNCDREPIRIPGRIQPYGFLLVLSTETLNILQISENVQSFLSLAPSELLGQPLSRVVGQQQAQSIQQTIESIQAAAQTARQSEPVPLQALQLPWTAEPEGTDKATPWQGLLHVHTDDAILELVPEDTATHPFQEDLYARLHQKVGRFQKADSFSALAQQIVQAVAELTGFDRVMVYQFTTNYDGTVIAEAMAPLLEASSFLGLRYPATDIPVPARELYLQNWSRLIPDVSYVPVPILPERHPLSQRPLDLSAVELRSVSPIHLEYLQNMGVKASMSISLIVEDRLWGLIACHHSQPKSVSFKVRSACEFLGQIASLELFRRQTLVEKRYLADVRSIQHQIRQTLARSPQPTHAISSVLEQHQQALLTLVRATGAAIALGDQITLIGQTPAVEKIQSLLEWLSQKRQDIYHTHSLSQDFALFEAEQDRACGLLVISIFLAQSSYHVLWFRPELVQLVEWAGQPSKPATVIADGSLYLTPRQSFERWKEAVHGQSLPWKSSEVSAAQELRSTLLLAALEFSQAALKQAASKAQIASQAKSQFLAKMSHELRTPLNAILGFSQLIHYHESLSPEQRDRLDIINRSGEHLLSLINDVLETSRIEAGQLRLNESCFDLHQIITSVRDMLTLRAVNKRLELRVEQTPQVPRYVWGDESKLRQIIINLVGNAIKFTEKGEVALSVSVLEPAQSSDDRVCVQFKVSDTGLGIEPENFSTIFEPFRQAEAGRQAYEGTGLGLSISRQNARIMGGDIQVQSQVNRGSTFVCQVQLGRRTADDLTVSPRSLQKVVALAADQAHYRVLVVEDVAENRQLLLSLLTTVGFEVRTATNGREAVEIWRRWHPHCIWMDLYMPQVDGYAATQQIRAEQATQSSAPPAIIALSASVIDHFHRDLVSFGFDDYVSKPFRVEEIFDKMAQHIGVRYRYADEASFMPANQKTAAVLPTDPAQIADLQSRLLAQPPDWKSAFHRAVLGAREEQIQQLIQQLRPASLTQPLQVCLDQLRFDLLQQIAEPLSP